MWALFTAVGPIISSLGSTATEYLTGGYSRSLLLLGGAFSLCLCNFASVVICCYVADKRSVKDLGLRLSLRWWLECSGGFLLGGALMSGIFAYQYLSDSLAITGYLEQSTGTLSFTTDLLVWLAFFVLAAFAEEIVHRSYQITNANEGLSALIDTPWLRAVVAVIVSVGFFVYIHLDSPGANTASMIGIALGGLMLGLAFLLTGRLALPLGLHIGWNFFQGNVFGFPVSGLRTHASFIGTFNFDNSLMTGGTFGPEASLPGFIAIVCGTVIIWLCFGSGKLRAGA
jgi:membrane protease YdiL (CAAX protease family)